jgi:hypothetical protein
MKGNADVDARAGKRAKLYGGRSRRARFVSHRQIWRRQRYLRRKTEQHQHPDRLPRQIEFPPFVAVPGRGWVRMMVVMPASAAGEQSDDRVVTAVVACLVISVTPTCVTELTDHVVCHTMTVLNAPPQTKRLAPNWAASATPAPDAAAAPTPAAKNVSQDKKTSLIQFFRRSSRAQSGSRTTSFA